MRLQYQNVEEGIFLSRPNRFVAQVELNGRTETVHVKNTGRCRELLIPGAKVYLERAENPARKTPYDLIAVQKGDRLINMDAQAPNAAAAEWVRSGALFPDLTLLRQEVRYDASRFDLYAEHGGRRTFLEVKGVTLEEAGVARFPDAPTERGTKHLRELIRCLAEGYEACLLLVIQMEEVRWFEPNNRTDPAFAEALRAADRAGVKILAYDCRVTPASMTIRTPVPVRL